MIPRSHVIAPSKNALHYLCRILCHWPCELPVTHCARLGTRRKSHCSKAQVNSPKTYRGRNSPGSLPNAASTPAAPKPVWRHIPSIRKSSTTSIGHTPTAKPKVTLDEAESRTWGLRCSDLVSKGELSEATKEFL
jgi:hypothetical protein